MQNIHLEIQDDFVPTVMEFLKSLPEQAVEFQALKKETVETLSVIPAILPDNSTGLSNDFVDIDIKIDPEIAQYAGLIKLSNTNESRSLLDFDPATTLEQYESDKAYI